MEGYPAVTKDNWDGGVQIGEEKDAGAYKDYIKWDKPFPMPPVKIMSAEAAYRYVLANVGATLPHRDAVDNRVIEQVRTGKIAYKEVNTDTVPQFHVRKLPKDSYKEGIITEIFEVGGYPDYKGTPYKDSDNDGLPDEYEIRHGLNPHDPHDSALPARDGSGYSNIEVWLNNLASRSEKPVK
jgi:hypothetical protein